MPSAHSQRMHKDGAHLNLALPGACRGLKGKAM
jgi:hypothetical protein